MNCQIYRKDNKYYGYEVDDESWFIWDNNGEGWQEIFMDSFENLRKIDEYDGDYLDPPDYNICPGCQRKEMHKMCPAYGTPWYMSGKKFTKKIEEYIRSLK